MFNVVLGIGLAVVFTLVWRRFASFWAQSPRHYANETPQFDLRKHFNGPMICEGVIYGPLGRVSSRFVANFKCSWQGNQGVMEEHFVYDSGATHSRVWALSVNDRGGIKATAPDVVGLGVGTQSGSAVRLKYKLRLHDSAGGHVLNTVDWMYLAPNGTIINRSQFRKFGIKVAELVATMRPVSDRIDT